MLISSILTALALIIGVYGAVHGSLYRKPYLLIVAGLIIGVSGALAAFATASIGDVPVLSEKFPYYELGANIITVLVSSVAGGLFVSAILLKSERMHKTDLEYARSEVRYAEGLKEMAIERDNNLKEIAKNMGTKEFWDEYSKIRELEFHAIYKLIEAQRKLEDLNL